MARRSRAARVRSRSMGRKWLRWLAWLATCGIAALAWAAELTVSAQVDKTEVDLGSPIHLTITLSGDLSGVAAPSFEFPEGCLVAARSQATNVSVQAGVVQRSMSLTYALVPQRIGTFQLGPFKVQQKKKTFETDPITITVNKPAVPPTLQPQGERFTL